MYSVTGCDFVMVGRAAQGNPFVFEEINAYLKGESYNPPSLEERFSVLLEQVRLMLCYKDSDSILKEAETNSNGKYVIEYDLPQDAEREENRVKLKKVRYKK